jgi:hypothetical protein
MYGVGHRVVWYMVMDVLEECSGSIFIGSQMMVAVWPDRNLGTHQSDYTIPLTWKTIILNLNILHFPCIVSLSQNN